MLKRFRDGFFWGVLCLWGSIFVMGGQAVACPGLRNDEPLAFLEPKRCWVEATLLKPIQTRDAERRRPGYCDYAVLNGEVIARKEAIASGSVFAEVRLWVCGNENFRVEPGMRIPFEYQFRSGHSLIQSGTFPGSNTKLQIFPSKRSGNLATWGEFKQATQNYLELRLIAIP